MKFSQTHEWVRLDDKEVTIGISDFAQQQLGEVVYVELPHIGQKIQAGEEAAVLESTKAAVDIYSPISGEIIAINDDVRNAPEMINHAAETAGWLFKLAPHNPIEMESLMNDHAYKKYILGT